MIPPTTETAETLARKLIDSITNLVLDTTADEQDMLDEILPLLLPTFTKLAAAEKALGECVKALELILKQTKEWNDCVEAIIGKQPKTGIETTQPFEALALAKQHLSS